MNSPPNQYFLLSPANCSGLRAQMLRRDEASFDLACRLRDDGAVLGEVFSFISGLYFRGKLAYAQRFIRTSDNRPGIYVITAGRGLLDVDAIIGLDDLKA